jgi:hypothetical protein
MEKNETATHKMRTYINKEEVEIPKECSTRNFITQITLGIN